MIKNLFFYVITPLLNIHDKQFQAIYDSLICELQKLLLIHKLNYRDIFV